ncbi:ATP-binding protein [Chachezhania sediminis]|uniref:ATP-binding protein n=1 Tax=Chachezhania sediminis TaxID=2599291 RepID=UPI00131E3F1E|nr:ATP-binding protein [Chachezhania sediminis]
MAPVGPRIELGFKATETGTRAALTDVIGRLRDGGLESTMLGCIEIVLAETLNNIVEHACAGQPDGQVRVRARLTDLYLLVIVVDNGRPYPGNRLPPYAQPAVACELDSLPEGGFGWALIRELTDHVQYRRHRNRNVLTLSIFLERELSRAFCR